MKLKRAKEGKFPPTPGYIIYIIYSIYVHSMHYTDNNYFASKPKFKMNNHFYVQRYAL